MQHIREVAFHDIKEHLTNCNNANICNGVCHDYKLIRLNRTASECHRIGDFYAIAIHFFCIFKEYVFIWI